MGSARRDGGLGEADAVEARTLSGRLRSMVWQPASPDGRPPLLRPQAVYPMLAFVVVSFGANWPLMSVGVRSISPLWMLGFRLIGASITLFVFTAVSGRLSRPQRADYPIVVSVAIFKLALVFLLVFVALETVPPGRSAILVWTASLWSVPIAGLLIGERITSGRAVGLTLGIAGILLVFEPTRLDWSDGDVILGHALLIVAAVLNASVNVHVRRHTWTSTPLGLLPWQVLVASVPVALIAVVIEGIPVVEWDPGLVFIVLYQGVIASGLAMWAQLTVLRSHPAISTNLALMAIPVVGLGSSALFVGESLTFAVVGGLVLVLAGVGINVAADARARANRAGTPPPRPLP